ncbi:MAG: SBBP repeat-containing protein [Pyrinomonadaceae bacterium]|nr:SBBP repeat-containing protein [Pyrinomonadaceae bacterium]
MSFRVFSIFFIITNLILLSAETSTVVSKNETEILEKVTQLDSYFEENRGQFNPKARFLVRGIHSSNIFLTSRDVVFLFTEDRKRLSFSSVHISINGAEEPSSISGLEKLPHQTNYLRGSKDKWITKVKSYKAIEIKDSLPKINLIWRTTSRGLKCLIENNDQPRWIEWKVEGAERVEVNDEVLAIVTANGVLEVKLPQNNSKPETIHIRESEDKVFYFGFEVGNEATVRFEIGTEDTSETLSSIPYSTFLGGSQLDTGNAIAVDALGNVYVTGRTISADFPTTPGAFDTDYNLGGDIFVAKLDSTGSSLIYSTFIGGSGSEDSRAIKVDTSGSVYVTGVTSSSDFPTTSGAFDTSYNGNDDAFITKLNFTGSGLIYSTFLGGSGTDESCDLVIDGEGSAFVTGQTSSFNFPTTPGAYDTTYNDTNPFSIGDVFITKISPSGSGLVYSTFLGSQAEDYGKAISIDNVGNVYVSGYTTISGFPVTTGSFDTTFNGAKDAFITKLNIANSTLDYSTYLGGSANDSVESITLDNSGAVYVTGETFSSGFPTTPGVFDTSLDGVVDAFLTKLNPSGSGLIYSTFLGGDASELGKKVIVDSSGNAYLSGYTTSSNFPTTTGAFDNSFNGDRDVFVSKFNSAASQLEYSTFLGGAAFDNGKSLAVDASGNVYVTGETDSSDYPVTAGAYDTDLNGFRDAFITKLSTVTAPSKPCFDFYGTGKTSFGVINNEASIKVWRTRSNGGVSSENIGYGFSSDVSVPGYYDSDNKMDIAVWRSGVYYIRRSTTGNPNDVFPVYWGLPTDTPGYEADYDGDGKDDLTVLRTSGANLVWFILRSSTDTLAATTFGLTTDIPLSGADYNGDGRADLTVLRLNNTPPETYFIGDATTGALIFAQNWGHYNTDFYVIGDFIGDNKADFAVWRGKGSVADGYWYVKENGGPGLIITKFGIPGTPMTRDQAVCGDYDGNGKSDIAVYRPSNKTFYWLTNPANPSSNQQFTMSFPAGTGPVTGERAIPNLRVF